MQPSAIENGPYDYTRSGNPTRDALERFDNNDMIGLCFVLQLRFILCFFAHSLLIFMFYVLSLLAKLDKADRALCFTSGMAALTAVVHLVGTGTFSFFGVIKSDPSSLLVIILLTEYLQGLRLFLLYMCD